MTNWTQRSVIASLGRLSYERRGMHVSVRAASTNEYGKFDIDSVLGRLTCPPEPRLLYSMALFHASTSFPLSDPLTASTGAEEACRILRSGHCQPWKPLVEGGLVALEEFKSLCPSREYYPRDKRTLQTVGWNRKLTTEIQHDCYEGLVKQIRMKSDRLRLFYAKD